MTQEEALKKFDEATGWLTNNPIDVLHRARAEFVEYINEVENRSCESCKHKYIVDSMTTECRDNDSPIDYLDLECFPEFSCNRWELEC